MNEKIPGSMQRLEETVKKVGDYLSSDFSNVAVLYCETGFEKSGLICICYLLYLGFYTETKEAIEFFAEQRLAMPLEFYNLMSSDFVRYFSMLQVHSRHLFNMNICVLWASLHLLGFEL